MKKLFKLFALIFLAFLLSSCTSRDLTPVVKPAEVPAITVPAPQPVNLPRPEFQVLNSEGVAALADKLKKNPDPNFNIYVMDYGNLEKLLNSLNSVGDYIGSKQAETDYYKNYLQSLKKPNQ